MLFYLSRRRAVVGLQTASSPVNGCAVTFSLWRRDLAYPLSPTSSSSSPAPPSGGFRHVQHVRPNRSLTKRGPIKGLYAGNNGRHPRERVKRIKATVMTNKKVASFFQENRQLTAGRLWLKRSPVFSRKNKVCRPTFFPNRALLRVNPALPPQPPPSSSFLFVHKTVSWKHDSWQHRAGLTKMAKHLQ